MSEAAEANNDGGEFAGLPAAAPEADSGGAQDNDSADAQQSGAEPGRPAYQPRVDLDVLPEDIRKPIEARFKHLSWTMKKNEAKLAEWQSLAAEQSEQIEKLTNGFGKVAAHLEDKTYADTEAQLAQKANTAWDAGDTKAYHEANRELMDLRVKKGIADALADKEKANPASKKAANRPAEEADDSDPGPEIVSWQEETTETGEPIRPWAKPDDPGYRQAYFELASIKTNPRMQHYSNAQIMQELDRRMGVTKPASRQNVMGANLTRGSKAAKVSISPKAEEVAVRMKLGGPKATREQHIDAYRKQLADIKGTRQ